VARRGAPKGRIKAFAIEPEVTINNQWSNRYTVIEVMGLDRPGLLYELTATLSKLSLNITSAHVATFGERMVDVFYVTDLLGAKISSPTREMAIKRALLQLFATADRPAAAQVAAAQ
jgi:[protein-PII] uridylyltransferase